jgi:high-affinity Fe2+/Pb2+ permease
MNIILQHIPRRLHSQNPRPGVWFKSLFNIHHSIFVIFFKTIIAYTQSEFLITALKIF